MVCWDATWGIITGSEDVWSKDLRLLKPLIAKNGHLRYFDIENKVCMHYEVLTTILYGSTARGSGTRASTQPTMEESGRGRRTYAPLTSNDMFSDEHIHLMGTPNSNRCTCRCKGTFSTFDAMMNTITEMNRIIQQSVT
ncbi:hypothetical protein STAS_16451 [Striga asiatica]|uniref:Uncharacterized protein n=1 Tax=Striga asiatica TaxID=4170 RepID=A0A5A7Q4J2_STRAF|nr:hypothetical protein STAS_16451 [Striga asiatica]